MKEYFFYDGQKQIGPISKDKIGEYNFTEDTLVWFDGLEDWIKLKDIEELRRFIVKPPPIPKTKLQDSQLSKKEKANPLLPSKKQIGYYLIWIVLLVFLYLLTLTDNEFIQEGGPEVSKLWPITSNFYAERIIHRSLTYACQTPSGSPCFYGILADYDFSEVLIYSSIPVLYFFIKRLLSGN
jgi:hypothetical protein